MELTLLVPPGRQVIERYGRHGFRVTGVIWQGPVLVFPDVTMPWSAADIAGVTSESLTPVVEHGGVQILLLGLGNSTAAISGDIRAALRQAGIAVEPMNTGAACRTYNVLVAEERRVAAALIPPI